MVCEVIRGSQDTILYRNRGASPSKDVHSTISSNDREPTGGTWIPYDVAVGPPPEVEKDILQSISPMRVRALREVLQSRPAWNIVIHGS
jgi:hypothetical protein